uniref:Sugar phosphate transporter domain-containing protein n=1 Tax=Rhizochromulina marina TaxID=1034831 RepID=A0A6U0Y8D2_9STRA
MATCEQILRTMGLCSLYMVVGPALVLLNKHILSELDFDFPMLLSSLGLTFAAVVAHLMAAVGVITIGKQEIVTRDFWMRRVLPVGACHAATLAFGNAQYLYMGIAMIQFLKAYTPIVVTGVAVCLLNDRPSLPIVLSLVALCVGTSATASMGDSSDSFGFFLAAGSATTEAIRLVLTQFVLQDCRFTLWESQYYLAPAGAACLIGLGLFVEGQRLQEQGALAVVARAPHLFLAAASLGLGVQLLTAAVIQATSSVTLKVLSQVRNAGLVMTGVVLYHEPVTFQQGVGYTASLIAFGFYNYFKLFQSSTQPVHALKKVDEKNSTSPETASPASFIAVHSSSVPDSAQESDSLLLNGGPPSPHSGMNAGIAYDVVPPVTQRSSRHSQHR